MRVWFITDNSAFIVKSTIKLQGQDISITSEPGAKLLKSHLCKLISQDLKE